MIKILSIGNSFSQDAQRYLYQVAKNRGDQIKTANLYIGGCSLETHYENMRYNKANYLFEFNGKSTGLMVSISQALLSDEWDVVTFQQASRFSGEYQTYQPYLTELVNYVKKFCPNAKIYMHQTWAYQDGSAHMQNSEKYSTAVEMFEDIKKSYQQACKEINATGIIPSGQALIRAIQTGIEVVHRDGLHVSLGVGRYLLALTWYKSLVGGDITNDNFNDFDEPVTPEQRKIVIDAVNWAILNN